MTPDGSVAELAYHWADEPPADQAALWALASPSDRAVVARRLRAALAYEAAGNTDALAHAAKAGVSLDRFNSIMRAWRRERSLTSLLPQLRRRSKAPAAVPEGIEAAAAAALTAADRGGLSREDVAKALRLDFPSRSLSWIRRLVARTARDVVRAELGGAAGFGRRIVVDSSALPLPLQVGELDEADEVSVEWAVAAFVWDAATGYVLGRAVGPAPADFDLHVAAAEDAADRLRRMRLRGPDGTAVIATTVPRGRYDAMETLRIVRRLLELGAEVPSVSAGGELLTETGGRFGSLALRPRYASDAFDGRVGRMEALERFGRVPLEPAELLLVVDSQMASRNAGLLDRVDRAAVDPVIVADGLDAVFGRLTRSG